MGLSTFTRNPCKDFLLSSRETLPVMIRANSLQFASFRKAYCHHRIVIPTQRGAAGSTRGMFLHVLILGIFNRNRTRGIYFVTDQYPALQRVLTAPLTCAIEHSALPGSRQLKRA